jgi:hypothetical protein
MNGDAEENLEAAVKGSIDKRNGREGDNDEV